MTCSPSPARLRLRGFIDFFGPANAATLGAFAHFFDSVRQLWFEDFDNGGYLYFGYFRMRRFEQGLRLLEQRR